MRSIGCLPLSSSSSMTMSHSPIAATSSIWRIDSLDHRACMNSSRSLTRASTADGATTTTVCSYRLMTFSSWSCGRYFGSINFEWQSSFCPIVNFEIIFFAYVFLITFCFSAPRVASVWMRGVWLASSTKWWWNTHRQYFPLPVSNPGP